MNRLVFDSSHPKDKAKSFRFVFWEEANSSDRIDIAVGYVDSASVARLTEYLRRNPNVYVRLFIGMQYLDGFARPQLESLNELDKQMRTADSGQILISESVNYHGKVYAFSNRGEIFSAYIGSGNLSSIAGSGKASYEAGLLVDSGLAEIEKYLNQRVFPLGTPFEDMHIVPTSRIDSPLSELEDVTVTGEDRPRELDSLNPTYAFELPLKAAPKSNLNAFFGKGRCNKSSGRTLPRPWYEVEIIVPKTLASDPYYPADIGEFRVVTDDGYSFNCKISGDFGKNFRSANSLSVLGAFVKGRLEGMEILSPGIPVTTEMLEDYGRDTLGLYYYRETDRWILDFSIKEENK